MTKIVTFVSESKIYILTDLLSSKYNIKIKETFFSNVLDLYVVFFDVSNGRVKLEKIEPKQQSTFSNRHFRRCV